MKSKTLFIISDFFPAGSQRQMYELDVECKRHGIVVEIPCAGELGENPNFPDEHYQRHLALDTKLTFLFELIKPHKYCLIERILFNIGLQQPDQFNFTTFTDNYSKVSFLGEYTYKALRKQLKTQPDEAINFVIVCSRFQSPQYRDFDKKTKFVFIVGFDDCNQVEWEYEGFENYRSLCVPISLVPTQQYKKSTFGAATPKKIGIFTRLSKQKPLGPFFYTVSFLLEQFPYFKLQMSGARKPEEAEHDRYIKYLQLKIVFFKGHHENQKQTIIKEKLDMVWYQGYLNKQAVNIGFDVALTRTPPLFWDFYGGENPNINQLDSIYLQYKNVSALEHDTTRVLTDQATAMRISENQFYDTCLNRNTSKNIETISHLLM